MNLKKLVVEFVTVFAVTLVTVAIVTALQTQATTEPAAKDILYGTLLSNVPDYNGSRVQVDRIEVEE